MPLPTITTKDADGVNQTRNTLPNAGQATAAESLPVALPAAQVTALTPPGNAGYATDAKLDALFGAVGASPAANTVLGRLKDLLAGTVLAAGSAVIGGVTQSGAWVLRLADGAGNAVTSAVRGSERALSVQVVDAAGAQITSFGGGGAGGGTIELGPTSLTALESITATGPLTDAQLRAAAVPTSLAGETVAAVVAYGRAAVTASAAAVGTGAAAKGVAVKALASNAADVYVGGAGVTAATGWPLSAGESITLPVDNASDVYCVAAAAGSSVAWIAL